jgi:hypothetical protein
VCIYEIHILRTTTSLPAAPVSPATVVPSLGDFFFLCYAQGFSLPSSHRTRTHRDSTAGFSTALIRGVMHSTAVHSLAEHICVYARVRPCDASSSGVSCVRVDTSQNTIHCGTDVSSPCVTATSLNAHTACYRSSAAPTATTTTANAETASARRPHPPPRRRRTTPTQTFTLDHVVGDLHGTATAAFLASTARTCSDEYLLEGKDVTVLCVGEQGSGKTSSLFGDEAEPGLCPRLLLSLFSSIRAASADSCGSAAAVDAERGDHHPTTYAIAGAPTQHAVTLSCILLQGERVVDLLAEVAATDAIDAPAPTSPSSPSSPAPSLSPPPTAVSMLFPSSSSAAAVAVTAPTISVDVHGKVVVRGVTRLACRHAEEAIKLVRHSRQAQRAALPSSIGHFIVTVDVVSQEIEVASPQRCPAAVAVARQSCLHIVDLASVHTTPAAAAASTSGDKNSSNATTTAAVVNCSKSQLSTSTSSSSRRAEENAIRTSLNSLRAVIVGLVEAAARESRTSSVHRGSSLTVHDSPYTATTHGAMRHAALSSSTSSATVSTSAAAATTLPYRHCKLTMLLKDYLGGGCHTIVFAHVRSEVEHLSESMATLRLARQLRCVPVHSETHRTVNAAVQVRQLQRQVTALQSDLRMQVELSKHYALLAAEALRDAAARTGEPATAATARTAAGKAASTQPSTRTTPQLASSVKNNKEVKGSAARRTTAERVPSPPSTLPAVPWPMPADKAPLQAAVDDFLAGRLPTLPVTTIEEMNTCFELLRRRVVERDVRLSAALTDLHTAQASAAASALLRHTEVSRRPSFRSPASRRSSVAGRASSPGLEKRRASRSDNASGEGVATQWVDTAAATTLRGDRQPSSMQPWGVDFRAPWATAAPSSGPTSGGEVGVAGARPYQTSLLEEPSPTRLAADRGVSYGSASAPATWWSPPTAQGPTPTPTTSAAVADAGALVAAANGSRVSWRLDERMSTTADKPSGVEAAAAVTPTTTMIMNGLPVEERSAMQSGNTPATSFLFRLPSTLSVGHKEADSAATRAASPSSLVEGDGTAYARQRGSKLSSSSSASPLQQQQQPVVAAPLASAAVAVPCLQSPLSAVAAISATAPPTPASGTQTKSSEALAFDMYVAETAEGRALAARVREAEAAVAAAQQRCHLSGATGDVMGVHVTCAAAVQQLTRRRQELLSNFEAWQCPRTMRKRAAATTLVVDACSTRPPTRWSASSATVELLSHSSTALGSGVTQSSSSSAAASLLRPHSASDRAALQIPRPRLRPSSATPMCTPAKSPVTTAPLSAVAAASIYRV